MQLGPGANHPQPRCRARPVAENDASTSSAQIMHSGSVRVPVDDPVSAGLRQHGGDRAGIDVHDLGSSHCGVRRAFGTCLRREGAPCRYGLRQELRLPLRIAQLPAYLLVLDVIGAQRIAMQQRDTSVAQRDQLDIAEQSRAAAIRKITANQKISIAVHESDIDAGIRQAP